MPTPALTADRRRDDRRSMWRIAVTMFGAGALTLFAIVPMPDPDTGDHRQLLIVGAALTAYTAALAVAGERSRFVDAAPVVAVLAIGVLIAVARPLGAMPMYYLWALLFAAYFVSRRHLLVVEGTMVVTYGVALTFSTPGLRAAYFVSVVICCLTAAEVVSHLKSRIDALVGDLGRSASTDPLTGLLNRRAFEAEFESELVRAARYHRPLTLAVFDLDHFKLVNDRFGHDLGDRALQRMAATLDAGRRGSDVVARLGGEEFAVLFVDTDEDEAHRAAARIAELLGQTPDGDLPPLSVSAGVAQMDEQAGGRVAMMRAADAALYRAKAAGRHRIASAGGQVTVTGEGEAALTAATRARTPLPGT